MSSGSCRPHEEKSHGAPRVIRTPDLRIRSPSLYPTELWARLLITAVFRGFTWAAREHSNRRYPISLAPVPHGFRICRKPVFSIAREETSVKTILCLLAPWNWFAGDEEARTPHNLMCAGFSLDAQGRIPYSPSPKKGVLSAQLIGATDLTIPIRFPRRRDRLDAGRCANRTDIVEAVGRAMRPGQPEGAFRSSGFGLFHRHGHGGRPTGHDRGL
jgi:hypothetical protein